METVLDGQQTLFDEWQHAFNAEQQWRWPVTPEIGASILEQQAAVQRHGLELTRDLWHLGWTTATPLVPAGEAMTEPVHTAIDDQFDLLATLHADSVEAIRTAVDRTTPTDEPIEIDITSATAESASTDTAAETAGDDITQSEETDAAIDYTELVAGTVPEIKDRVETEDVDIDQVIAAEQAGESRTTLLDWLEGYEEEE